MYLISAYFDEESDRTIRRYIEKVAEKTGNRFMIDNNVPPHMTISSIEARSVEDLIPAFDSLEGKLVVATTKDTIMNTVTDATIANTVVTGVTATGATSSAPTNAVTDVYTVTNGVLTLNWLVATPATNAVFQVTPTPPTP